MGLCIVNVFFRVYQQDATLYNILYYCQCSTCFRRFSAHHQLKTVHTASGICQAFLLLPLQASLTYTRCCVYSLELLMMGEEIA